MLLTNSANTLSVECGQRCGYWIHQVKSQQKVTTPQSLNTSFNAQSVELTSRHSLLKKFSSSAECTGSPSPD